MTFILRAAFWFMSTLLADYGAAPHRAVGRGSACCAPSESATLSSATMPPDSSYDTAPAQDAWRSVTFVPAESEIIPA